MYGLAKQEFGCSSTELYEFFIRLLCHKRHVSFTPWPLMYKKVGTYEAIYGKVALPNHPIYGTNKFTKFMSSATHLHWEMYFWIFIKFTKDQTTVHPRKHHILYGLWVTFVGLEKWRFAQSAWKWSLETFHGDVSRHPSSRIFPTFHL